MELAPIQGVADVSVKFQNLQVASTHLCYLPFWHLLRQAAKVACQEKTLPVVGQIPVQSSETDQRSLHYMLVVA